MLRKSAKRVTEAEPREFLAFDDVSIRFGEKDAFIGTNWTWRAGEQWAVLGPDGAGKSLFIDALLGRASLTCGEVRGPCPDSLTRDRYYADFAYVSPETQRELAIQEGSFYQLRWHSSLEEGPRSVAGFLSLDSVEERNPYEVGAHLRSRRAFEELRKKFINLLGIGNLLDRKLIQLSNGEMRKTLLVHAMLKSPRLLVLDDPYAGLDAATRKKLREAVLTLMRGGWSILVATNRLEEIPSETTHLLLIDGFEVVAQGSKRAMLRMWRERFGDTKVNNHQASPSAKRSKASVLRQRGEPVLELKNVNVSGADRTILAGISWTVREGECWALLGPNGAGKTTLLNLIQGDHPQAYSVDIRLFGQATATTQAVWNARQHIGWMSPELHQHYPITWTAHEVVCSGFFNSIGLYEACTKRQQVAALQWLADTGLARFSDTPFGELSFGQQRLVLLARAAVKVPRLLILDEPCQGLDAAQRRTMLSAVDRIVNQSGATLIFVTHHKDEVPRCVSQTLRLKRGRIVDPPVS